MKQCLECGSAITRRKFCSKKCSAVYRSKNTCAISKDQLNKAYTDQRLELADISQKYGVSVATLCNYLRKYQIPKRGNHIDFTGKKIGELQVIEPVQLGTKGGKHIKWKCVCSCGAEVIAFSHHLSRSLTVRCQTCASKSRRSELELKVFMWNNIKRAADNRKIEFAITREWAYDLFVKQDRRCALSGAAIEFAECTADYNNGKMTASLDRIDSARGYTEDNVQWVHKVINFMKGELCQSEFKEWCGRVFKTPTCCS